MGTPLIKMLGGNEFRLRDVAFGNINRANWRGAASTRAQSAGEARNLFTELRSVKWQRALPANIVISFMFTIDNAARTCYNS